MRLTQQPKGFETDRLKSAMRAIGAQILAPALIWLVRVSNPSVFGWDIQPVTPMDALHIKSHTCFPMKTKRWMEPRPPKRRSLSSDWEKT